MTEIEKAFEDAYLKAMSFLPADIDIDYPTVAILRHAMLDVFVSGIEYACGDLTSITDCDILSTLD